MNGRINREGCPRFNEPSIASDGSCVLRHCGGQLVFDKLEDERPK
jgi:hypothetical protein